MARRFLTQQMVTLAQCPENQQKKELTDCVAKGLFLEVRRSGGKTWYLRYTNERGRQRCFRLGDAGLISLPQARKKVSKILVRLALGEDPVVQKKLKRAVPTFENFVIHSYLPYVKTYKRSWDSDVSLLKVHLLPRFAERYLDEIGREDIQRMHIDRRMQGAAPGSANHLLILMRYMFNLAKKWEIPGAESNPTEGIPLMAVNNMKERYLSIEEANALYEAVCRSENRMLQFIVPMLLFTGARKREVLDAQWKDFDVDRKLWRIPLSKSGKARFVPLSDGALHVLKQVPRENHSAWVFSNPKTGLPFVTIFTSWNTARTSVGLGDVRMHDLRHSFASLLINSGRSLYEVQKLLGHTQVQTTQRYAHLAPQTLLQASNEATKALQFILR